MEVLKVIFLAVFPMGDGDDIFVTIPETDPGNKDLSSILLLKDEKPILCSEPHANVIQSLWNSILFSVLFIQMSVALPR